MTSIYNSIGHFNDLPEEKRDYLKSKVITKKIKRGTILQEKGSLKPKAFYVKSGLLRSYIIDEKGKEHVFIFAPEGWILSEMILPNNNVPAELFVDAIEDSEIEIVDSEIINEFPNLLPEGGAKIEIEKLMKRISVLQKRVIMLMSASAIERYNEFIKTYPNIIQRVPQKMIASYLGITPEALSKLKGEQLKKHQ